MIKIFQTSLVCFVFAIMKSKVFFGSYNTDAIFASNQLELSVASTGLPILETFGDKIFSIIESQNKPNSKTWLWF